MAGMFLPPKFAPSEQGLIAQMRPTYLQALRIAAASGDARTARTLFAAVAGPSAAARLGPRNVLETVDAWLTSQSVLAGDISAT